MTIEGPPPPKKVIYNDYAHRYFMDGVMCKSVSGVAKIPTDTWTLEQWAKRHTALGMALDRNLCEKILTDPDNKELGDAVVEDAMKTADTHRKADRGTQMHKVLELMLIGQPDRLLSDQQRADALVLRRTLDRYKLVPHDGMAEQFVAWPIHRIGGRFDAILECPDGRLVLTDLKTGPNAVTYPHTTACQLALYARAPWISDGIEVNGDQTIVTRFRKMPERLDYRNAYVLLVEPDAAVGTLHEIDIEHGWAGARKALEIVLWRNKFNKGKDMVREVPDFDPMPSFCDRAMECDTVEELRELWREAKRANRLDSEFITACEYRLAHLGRAS